MSRVRGCDGDTESSLKAAVSSSSGSMSGLSLSESQSMTSISLLLSSLPASRASGTNRSRVWHVSGHKTYSSSSTSSTSISSTSFSLPSICPSSCSGGSSDTSVTMSIQLGGSSCVMCFSSACLCRVGGSSRVTFSSDWCCCFCLRHFLGERSDWTLVSGSTVATGFFLHSTLRGSSSSKDRLSTADSAFRTPFFVLLLPLCDCRSWSTISAFCCRSLSTDVSAVFVVRGSLWLTVLQLVLSASPLSIRLRFKAAGISHQMT